MHSFIFPGVVSKFSYREICCPVGLSSIDKLSQVYFNLLIHAFTLSICSRVKCGAKIFLIPMALHSVLTRFPVNLGSLSDMIHLGMPYQGKRCWRYSSATSSVISLLQGMNLVALEHSWSTIVRMLLYPLDLGRSVIKSMETYWKGPSSVGVLKWCKGA